MLLLYYYYYYYILFQATLGQRLWLIMNNIPDNVANAPASVVTALRIVQREEKLVIDIKNCNFYNITIDLIIILMIVSEKGVYQ